jgi:hypothetical protein
MRVLPLLFLVACANGSDDESPGWPMTAEHPSYGPVFNQVGPVVMPDSGVSESEFGVNNIDLLSHVCREPGESVQCADDWCRCAPRRPLAPLLP